MEGASLQPGSVDREWWLGAVKKPAVPAGTTSEIVARTKVLVYPSVLRKMPSSFQVVNFFKAFSGKFIFVVFNVDFSFTCFELISSQKISPECSPPELPKCL